MLSMMKASRSIVGGSVAEGYGSLSLASPFTEQKRFLKFAKSTFGFKIPRRGQRTFAKWREPSASSRAYRIAMYVPHYWSYNGPRDPKAFLPKSNFITGDWTGLGAVPRDQIFTLQHATSGATVRIKRHPTHYTFNNPSRWLIGKPLRNWVMARAKVIDEATITKRQRMILVKKGLLPKE